MRIVLDVPAMAQTRLTSLAENALVMRALLNCLIQSNLAYLKFHAVPPLYQAGIVYGRTTVWEAIPALYAPKLYDADRDSRSTARRRLYGLAYGDCKSLTAARVAELRMVGQAAEAEFRYVENAQGGFNYHILVRLPNGTNEDPSKICGMGKDENAYFANARPL